ncbi:MAG: hypothetical protein WC895_03610 [Candidatus Shapirobacteria bacterium]|jgi:hypothetical protein
MTIKKIFLILIIISPIFWWQFLAKPNKIFQEYKQIPLFIKNKVSSIFKNTQYIAEFRWNDTTKDNRPIAARFFYNKSQLIVGESIIYLNNLNPRFYFQSGSGQPDSPPQIEPIAILLLPISFMGIFRLIKNKKFKIIFVGLISCFFGYITGQINFYFLFSTALFYLYTSAYEISFWTKKTQRIFFSILIIYSLFLFFRVNLIFR